MRMRQLHQCLRGGLRYGVGNYIALKNHNIDIQMSTGKEKLSYMDPRHRAPNAPLQPVYEEDLPIEAQQEIQYKEYNNYKQKMLKGIIDKEEVITQVVDDIPTHYYRNLSKVQLMTVSHPQSADSLPFLNTLFQAKFQPLLTSSLNELADIFSKLQKPKEKSSLTLQPMDELQNNQEFFKQYQEPKKYFMQPTLFTPEKQSPWIAHYDQIKSYINGSSFEQLVELALLMRKYDCRERQLWYAIETKFKGGQFLMRLKPYQLLKLKYAFDHRFKFGEPKFHKILASLLAEDIPRFDYFELIDLFYACRYSNPGQTNLQLLVLKQLQGHYSRMTYAQKLDLFFIYASCSKPLRIGKAHHRERFQFRKNAHNLLFKLKLDRQNPNADQCAKLIYSLAKLRATNTRHISEPILQALKQSKEFYEKAQLVYIAIAYLPEVEGGIGLYNKQVFQKLKIAALNHWPQYSNVERIRMVHTYWNYNLGDKDIMRMYLSIQIKAESTLLYYFAKIEPYFPSFRLREVFRHALCLPIIPLPYYQTFKRFYLTVQRMLGNACDFQSNLRNTEYYHDAIRFTDQYYNSRLFKYYKLWAEYSGLPVAHSAIPINNLEIVHFAWPEYQICVDLLNETDFVPGTKTLKASYYAKTHTLHILNWRLLSFDEEKFRALDSFSQLGQIVNAKNSEIKSQQQILQNEEMKKKLHLIQMEEYMDLIQGTQEQYQDFINNYQHLDKKSSILNLGNKTIDLKKFHSLFRNGLMNLPIEESEFKKTGLINEARNEVLPKVIQMKKKLKKLSDLSLAKK